MALVDTVSGYEFSVQERCVTSKVFGNHLIVVSWLQSQTSPPTVQYKTVSGKCDLSGLVADM